MMINSYGTYQVRIIKIKIKIAREENEELYIIWSWAFSW